MAGKFCITFTGGGRIGDAVELTPGELILVGRSHSADIRVKEADVSGRHLEILLEEGMWGARNIGRFGSRVDGRELVGNSVAPIKKGSVVEVGSKVRFRIDSLPVDGADDGHTSSRDGIGRQTGDTRFSGGATIATRFSGGETVATVAGAVSDGKLRVAQGCVEESATIDVFMVKDSLQQHEPQPEPVDSGIVMGVEDSDAETADEDPPKADGNDARTDVLAEVNPQGAFPLPEDIAGDSAGFAAEAADQQTNTDCATGDGETQELQTRIGSYEEILERKRQLERRVAAKHWRFGVLVALVLAAFGAIWLASATRRNVTDVEGPFLPDGEKDIVYQEVYDAEGGMEIFIECPRNDAMRAVWSSDSNRFELVSWIGRDRDVPFRLTFTKEKDPEELRLSMEESFTLWMSRKKAENFAFPDRNGRPVEREFWEDVFPGWMESQTQCGIPFVRSEYTRTAGSIEWRGMCFRLRDGDTAYCVLSEIPETYWKRGGYRISSTPFIGLYSRFVDRQWDSPGKDRLMDDFDEDTLISKVRHELTARETRAWTQLEKWVDTLMAMTWGKKNANAKSARECLDAFMARKTLFYNEKKLAYNTAKLNRDEKRQHRIFMDCRHIFKMLKHDRHTNKINNPEFWGCLNQQ